jgi:UDP-N-acetylmuramoylalanine--D-glutamate ligase
MNIAIVGYDVEGRSSFEYFKAGGHELTILDQDSEIVVPDGVPAVLGENYLDYLERFDLVVRTAGLEPYKLSAKNPGIEAKTTTHINEFFKASPTRQIIGVTGTKGKGTTCSLIAGMLQAAGKDVQLGGNIGVPALSFLPKLNAGSWVVLELSSFQLIDLQRSPHISVCLMVTPEHLNWHSDVKEYIEAKSQLFAHQSPEDIAIYYAKNRLSEQIAAVGPGQKIPYYAPPGATIDNGVITIGGQNVCSVEELKLLGAHNWQNACAAVTAVWQITQDIEAMRTVLTTFSGLPHRLELVRELRGVRYYDDSFGTNPETAIAAIEAFTEPEIVILGGRSKGASYDELAATVARHKVKKVIAIGETADEITVKLAAAGFTDVVRGGQNITEITQQAQQLAAPGDVVLLSTAYASFDMFKNYKQRGELFNQAVQALV